MRIAEPPVELPDFELTDQDGKLFQFSSLRGRTVLVTFGFTHCPDVCPTTLTKLRTLERQYPEQLGDTAVVMISVDGDRDTPAVMKTYLAGFSSKFIGLTGQPDKVRDVAERFPAIFFKEPPQASSGNYLVSHSSQVYAVDSHGRLRAELYDASLEAIAIIVAAMH